MDHAEELTGTVDRFLFQSADNGFGVLILSTKNTDPITVKGYFPNVNPGQYVTIAGAWVMHPKFGKQFEAASCTTHQPTSIVGLKKYLGSGLIKGIGPTYAEKLVNHFGTDVLEIIDKNPDRLKHVPGIGPKRIEKIMTAWKDQKEISKVMVFLQDKGISTAYATKIYKKYGMESVALVTENPYRLAEEIWGIGFKTADQIAQNLGFEKNSIQRIKAGILFAITSTIGNGHLYVELKNLKEKTVELLELDEAQTEQTLKQSLHDLYNCDKIKLITHADNHYVTLSQYYAAEKGVAHKLLKLIEYPMAYGFDLQQVYKTLSTQVSEAEVMLNEDQQRGIMACLQNKVTIITGGPGTGKTTLIKKLLGVLDEYKLEYKLAAPTGRAAKRIIEGTGRYAQTIHRLLEFDFTTFSFTHNEQNALKVNFLIIDEASMIDIFMANAILKAVPLTAHLIFIGDIDQLPSVGAGNFLNDLIASNKATCIRLNTIFRQAQDSLIVVNAHRINKGEFPTTNLPGSKRDFIFIKEDDPTMVPEHLRNIFVNGLKKYGIPAADSMVLVPMNRGSVGTQKLNHDLQQLLNPTTSEKQVTSAGSVYKIGDRVMQIKNNYDKKVFNGDMGTIEDIDLPERMLIVRYTQDRTVEYDFSDLDELVLAYAISIHKSQGSEFPAVIIPIFMQHFMLLQRNLIYTAITRAKKLCIFIGQPRAIAMAINNNKGLVRTTFLTHYLTTALQCRS